MGKQSDFERNDNDFYPTPEGREDLRHFLRPKGFTTFAEPCGEPDEDINVELESSRDSKCVFRGDNRTTRTHWHANQFQRMPKETSPTRRIKRHLLHPLIVHLSSVAPSWLLIDSGLDGTPTISPVSHILHDHRADSVDSSGLRTPRTPEKTIFVGIGSTPNTKARPSFTDAHHEPGNSLISHSLRVMPSPGAQRSSSN